MNEKSLLGEERLVSLPTEQLIEILRHASVPKLLALAQVSKRFNALCFSNTLWKMHFKTYFYAHYQQALEDFSVSCAEDIPIYWFSRFKEKYQLFMTGTTPVTKAFRHAVLSGNASLLESEALRAAFEGSNEGANAFRRKHSVMFRLACMNGHTAVVDRLLQAGFEPNLADKNNETPLLKACAYGHVAVVQRLLEVPDISVNGAKSLTKLPLSVAIKREDEVIVKMLLKKGASLFISEFSEHEASESDSVKWRFSSICAAAQQGCVAILECVLEESLNQITKREQPHQDNSDERWEERVSESWRAVVNLPMVNGMTALHFAAAKGHATCVQILLQQGADPCLKTKKGLTPIQLAVNKDKRDVIEAFLACDRERVLRGDNKSETTLHYAVACGRVRIACQLLAAGADPQQTDGEGMTSLHWAAVRGHLTIVKFLSADKTLLNQQDNKGRTPLHHAVVKNNKQCIRILLQAGADAAIKDSYDYTPLSRACELNNDLILPLLFNHLLRHKQLCFSVIDTHMKQAIADGHLNIIKQFFKLKGMNKLKQSTCTEWFVLACDKDQLDVIQFLKTKNIVTTLPQQASYLHIFARNGAVTSLKSLLKEGEAVEAKDESGATPLHYAASAGMTESIKLLLEHKANIHAQDDSGASPLHHAAANGMTEAIEVLCHHGADVHAEDHASATPLHYAAEITEPKSVEVLIDIGADLEAKDHGGAVPLHYAASVGRVSVASALLARGAKLDAINKKGASPFFFAAYAGCVELVHVFLEAGAYLNQKTDDSRSTPLIVAADCNHAKVVELLLSNPNCQIDEADCFGMSALHHAAKGGYVEIAQALLVAGTDYYSQSEEGLIPIAYAVLHGHVEMVQCFLQHDRDQAIWATVKQETLLHFAASRDCAELGQLLVRYGADPSAQDINGHRPEDWSGKFMCIMDLNANLLKYSAQKGGSPSVKALLTAGADPYIQSTEALIPIVYAVINDDTEMVRCLLEHAPDQANWTNHYGDSLVHFAAKINSVAMIQLLVEYGADPCVKDCNGHQPKDWARKVGAHAATNYLAPETLRDSAVQGFGRM